MIHASKQSVLSFNFSSINALKRVKFFACKKERSIGLNKRKKAVEDNEARELHLSGYRNAYCLNYLIKNTYIEYRLYKYCHAPKNYRLLVLYKIYSQVANREVREE